MPALRQPVSVARRARRRLTASALGLGRRRAPWRVRGGSTGSREDELPRRLGAWRAARRARAARPGASRSSGATRITLPGVPSLTAGSPSGRPQLLLHRRAELPPRVDPAQGSAPVMNVVTSAMITSIVKSVRGDDVEDSSGDVQDDQLGQTARVHERPDGSGLPQVEARQPGCAHRAGPTFRRSQWPVRPSVISQSLPSGRAGPGVHPQAGHDEEERQEHDDHEVIQAAARYPRSGRALRGMTRPMRNAPKIAAIPICWDT